MAFAGRPDSFLPVIKCSTCGVDINMAALADHVCASDAAAQPYVPHATGFMSRFAGARTPTPDAASPYASPKFGRSNLPPRIDAESANKQYLQPMPPTPGSYDGRYEAPRTPVNGQRSAGLRGFGSAAHSVRNAPPSPPSPGMDLGYDNPFPPWPSSPAVGGRQTPSRRDRDQAAHHPPRNPRWEEERPMSPGQNVLNRMNTIAKGPFDSRLPSGGQQSQLHQPHDLGHARKKTSESLKDLMRSRSRVGSTGRPSTANAKTAVPSMYQELSQSNPFSTSNPYTDASSSFDDPPESRRTREAPGPSTQIDKFFEQMRMDAEFEQPPPPLRSNTFPEDRRGPAQDFTFRDDTQDETPQVPYRSRSTGDRSRNDVRLDDAPPVPRLHDLQTQFPGIAHAHSPTDSASSGRSVFSASGSNSSRSSPPDSEVGSWSRKPSDASTNHDYFGSSTRGRSGTLTGRHRPDAEPMSQHTRQRSRTLNGLPPPPVFRQPGVDRGHHEPLQSPPIDPAIQPGIYGSARRPSNSSSRAPLYNNGLSTYGSGDDGIYRPPTRDLNDPASALARLPTNATRSPCRGCGALIIGKAIKAADGRLTGRWHKECFSCRTCHSAFPTGDFYVIDDHPYCERHYHTLNDSLCGACDAGIEGQYLETDRGRKYHRLCFTCDACDIPLRDEYYEVVGKQYCERHAWAVAQRHAGMLAPSNGAGAPSASAAGGGGRAGGYRGMDMLQKRSTRLVMM